MLTLNISKLKIMTSNSNDDIPNQNNSLDNPFNQTQNNEKFIVGGEQQVVVSEYFKIFF